MTTLVYCGAHLGATLKRLMPQYDQCFVFEPLPDCFRHLQKMFKNHPYVKIFNYAVDKEPGKKQFYVYNNLASSALSPLTQECLTANKSVSPEWENMQQVGTTEVECINLYDFLISNGITKIDYFMSDIQGMDYTVLETLKPFIDSNSIDKITCEVEKNEVPISYKGLNNKLSQFEKLLGNKYSITSVVTEPHWETSDITWTILHP